MKFLIILILLTGKCLSQGKVLWTQKATLADTGRQVSATFVIGAKAYLVSGDKVSGQVWEYNAVSNSWTKKAQYPGGSRWAASGFSIGSKGYVCGGRTNSGGGYSDLWEYDPNSDTWALKAPFPGPIRDVAVAFSIGNKGYFGSGRWIPGSLGSNDFWEYDSQTDSWKQLSPIPGAPLEFAIGFAINNKGYVGGGGSSQLHEFDPTSNTWITKITSGFSPAQASSFVLDSCAYICGAFLGGFDCSDSLSRYNAQNNTYTYIGKLPAGPRCNSTAFSVSGKGYFGFGISPAPNKSYTWPNDLHEFGWDLTASVVTEKDVVGNIKLYPNPCTGKLSLKMPMSPESIEVYIYNADGTMISQSSFCHREYGEINLTKFSPGFYLAAILYKNEKGYQKILLQSE